MADILEITLTDNEDLVIPLAFVDQVSGIAHDFTGSTFKMQVKTTAEAASAEYELTTANGRIASTDLANGAIDLKFVKGQLAVGAYVYDLIRVNGADNEKLIEGSVTVSKGVTP